MSDDKTETPADRAMKAGGITSPGDDSAKRPTMRLVKYVQYEVDWDKVYHWTELKEIIRVMNWTLAIDFDDPDCQFQNVRHLLKEVK